MSGLGSGLRARARRLLVTRLHRSGRFFTRAMPLTDVRALLADLQPVVTDVPLIRVGPKGDGGYLVPDDLGGIEACFSPGVADISDFELDCANRGMRVFLADRSVDGPAVDHANFEFVKRHLGANNDDGTMTLDRWVSESGVEADAELMLQIDIEGAEYEVFLNASEQLLSRFRIIVAEFHMLDDLFDAGFFRIGNAVMCRLLLTHHCVHIHPNNCCGSVAVDDVEVPRVAEFTFLRRDRAEASGRVVSFPHPLDAKNTVKPPLPLAPAWFPRSS